MVAVVIWRIVSNSAVVIVRPSTLASSVGQLTAGPRHFLALTQSRGARGAEIAGADGLGQQIDERLAAADIRRRAGRKHAWLA
jgi:hypothetical protein